MSDLGEQLCAWAAALRPEALPASVTDTARRLVLDGLAVIGGAARAPGMEPLHARLSRWEAQGSATALLGKYRLSPPSAALANGAAAHALDFDDLHDPARVHTTCVMLPTLLAVAEEVGGIGGKEFLLAMAIGAELHARFGLACQNSLAKGWHPTMVFGTMAAAVAAGRMLGLDATRLGHALGLAYHQASGSAQSMRDGALSKRLGAGFAARAAVLAVFLASDGLTSTYRTLEGDAGLFALYERGEVDRAQLSDHLGSRWQMTDYSLKPYPGCRCNHTTIGLGIRLHREGLHAADIEAVEIGMGRTNWLTVGQPYEPSRNSIVHAQFNAAYSFARAVMDGRVDLGTYEPQAIVDPAAAALARVTRVIDDAAIDPNAIEPARVSVQLKNGRRIELRSDTIKGSPQDPMSGDELRAKVGACLAYGLGAPESDAARLTSAVDNLADSRDVGRTLVDAFPNPSSGQRSGPPC